MDSWLFENKLYKINQDYKIYGFPSMNEVH